ncbi:hypothetical protein BDQ17DRAFT_1367132 [Cyathus striatus]|nr:hypothetical protein BDQ17DRAFT_1367132 [Cyathus striatus]
MSLNVCTHKGTYLLPEDGILCMLCSALRHLATISPKYTLSMAMEKLSTWTNRIPTISVLPDEILIEIFQHYLALGSRIYLADKPTRISSSAMIRSSPVPLTHVCHNWRQLINSSPLLWASIAVHNPRRKHIPLVRLWLDRARSCPLSIHIHQNYSERYIETETILELCIDRCHQWKSISFRFRDVHQSLTNISFGSMKNLDHASLHIPKFSKDDKDKIWANIHSSPRISNVEWSLPLFHFRTAPWEHLKVIEYRYQVPINEFLHILKSCRNLETLHLLMGASKDHDALSPPAEFITLPSLKELCLAGFNDRYCTIFDTITTPQLASLTIHLIDSRPENLISFKQFMIRSRCKLQSFAFASNNIEAPEFLQWLDMPGMSSITEMPYLDIRSKMDMHNLIHDPHQTYIESVIARGNEFILQQETGATRSDSNLSGFVS